MFRAEGSCYLRLGSIHLSPVSYHKDTSHATVFSASQQGKR